MIQLEKLTLFYDGACPLCQAEILFLTKRNQAGLLSFVDINSRQYDPSKVGVSCDQALASMYAQYERGKLINGVEVFLQAYQRANLPVLVWFFSRPYLRPILNVSYQLFARFRHPISRTIGPMALRLVTSSQGK
ncbi:DUF393 domain-containing protein [Polynucleobacter paneuropaeus]|uniref:thiol-disulfide oxidoreductase DCC family protein n=1 Tax=Polynucleobacter paneuropaeus TaxID=2527775 RepID=UPI000DBF2079|nr:DUF393 domain-containing protein [Polynucleobacter paneuropaeus]AWW45706.1 DUF393 domain-containing protein [Polynucleobacter paneuropaeus]